MQTATENAEQPVSEFLKIGEFHEQNGGIFAGIAFGENNQPDYYLFAAPKEQGKAVEIEWGSFGTEAEVPNSEFDGAANTKALAESEDSHPAAEWAHNLTIGKHSDYYLPAKREAILMAASLGESLGTEWHWTSTQYSAGIAWGQDFEVGSHHLRYKDDKLAVRAVRRVYLFNN